MKKLQTGMMAPIEGEKNNSEASDIIYRILCDMVHTVEVTEMTAPKDGVTNSDSEEVVEEVHSIELSEYLHFTEDEDKCLRRGVKKFGCKNWVKVLGFKNYRFHVFRTAESLHQRAKRLGLVKNS